MFKKDFLSITDLKAEEIWFVLNLAKKMKTEYKKTGENKSLLKSKTMVMIFEKPSLRTRLSFEVAMTQLGGHAIYLAPNDIGFGVRESFADMAKVASSIGDILMARTFKHSTIKELAKFSIKPVINGLSDLEHPCQILADLLTIWENKGDFSKLKLAFIGDSGNNVAHSLALASALLGMNFVSISPYGYWMDKKVSKKAKALSKEKGGYIIETAKINIDVKDADIIYTDTWVSMGDEKEKQKRLKIFLPYQVTTALVSLTKENSIFMHDLPAYRGNEVVKEVIDGEKSVVFQQAENRLHVQKALVLYLLNKYED